MFGTVGEEDDYCRWFSFFSLAQANHDSCTLFARGLYIMDLTCVSDFEHLPSCALMMAPKSPHFRQLSVYFVNKSFSMLLHHYQFCSKPSIKTPKVTPRSALRWVYSEGHSEVSSEISLCFWWHSILFCEQVLSLPRLQYQFHSKPFWHNSKVFQTFRSRYALSQVIFRVRATSYLFEHDRNAELYYLWTLWCFLF